MGEIVKFQSNGDEGMGYLAKPTQTASGAVIVIQEWWGLVNHIKDVTDRFAAEGFYALAPDLYRGKSTSEPDEAAKEMMALNLARAAKDISGAIAFLIKESKKDKVGIVGFCMGGGLALWAACNNGEEVSAVVSFYGVIPWENATPDYSKMNARFQGHYASNDSFASQGAIEKLKQDLENCGINYEIYIYPNTQHAFFNNDRPEVYDAESSRLAWQRTVDFFKTYLG